MATSSIFHNVKIDTPEKAEAFVAALEASEKEPWTRVSGTGKYSVETDPDVISKLHEMRKARREQFV